MTACLIPVARSATSPPPKSPSEMRVRERPPAAWRRRWRNQPIPPTMSAASSAPATATTSAPSNVEGSGRNPMTKRPEAIVSKTICVCVRTTWAFAMRGGSPPARPRTRVDLHRPRCLSSEGSVSPEPRTNGRARRRDVAALSSCGTRGRPALPPPRLRRPAPGSRVDRAGQRPGSAAGRRRPDRFPAAPCRRGPRSASGGIRRSLQAEPNWSVVRRVAGR